MRNGSQSNCVSGRHGEGEVTTTSAATIKEILLTWAREEEAKGLTLREAASVVTRRAIQTGYAKEILEMLGDGVVITLIYDVLRQEMRRAERSAANGAGTAEQEAIVTMQTQQQIVDALPSLPEALPDEEARTGVDALASDGPSLVEPQREQPQRRAVRTGWAVQDGSLWELRVVVDGRSTAWGEVQLHHAKTKALQFRHQESGSRRRALFWERVSACFKHGEQYLQEVVSERDLRSWLAELQLGADDLEKDES